MSIQLEINMNKDQTEDHNMKTPLSKDQNERKRPLSEGSDPTGVSPELKKLILNRGSKFTMPSDDATELEWNKIIYLKIDEMFGKFEELQSSLTYSEKELEDCQKDITDMKTEIADLKAEVTTLKRHKQELTVQYQSLQERQVKFETQMREQNMIFDGINETFGENPGLLHNKIVSVLDHMMVFGGNGSTIPFSKIERLGPYVRGRNRPIICHFARYYDVELLMKNRSQLPNNVYVREDFPTQIEDRRRILRPIFNKAKKTDQFKGKCRLVYDKLILDGKTFSVNNLDKLPKNLQPRSMAERHCEDTVVFFTKGSPFSNFYAASFVKDQITYVNNEQYIQSKKAELFNDDETHMKIMQSTNPYEIKGLGSRVKNFVKPQWENSARQVALDACTAKFEQNSVLKDILLETGNKDIGEASSDPFWGIGKTLNDANVFDKGSWTNNLLGNVLMTVRNLIK